MRTPRSTRRTPHEPIAGPSADRRRIALVRLFDAVGVSARRASARADAPTRRRRRCTRTSGRTSRRSRPRRPRPRPTSTRDCGWSTASITSRRSAPSARRPASIRRAPCATGAWPSPMARTTTARPTRSARTPRSRPSLQARALSPRATERERAVIAALAARHGSTPNADRAALDRAYADAMRDVARRFPDDLDAATLFADAMMNLRPWALWTPDGKPEPGTEEIVVTLERVLAANPNHPGANHLYIHAVEGSPDTGARRRRRRSTGRAHARRGAHGPHAVAHLLPGRPLRGRGGGQRAGGEGRPRVLRRGGAERHLPHDVLPAQPRLHLACREHGGAKRRDRARRARVRGGRPHRGDLADVGHGDGPGGAASWRWPASAAGTRSCASRRRPRECRTSPACGATRAAWPSPPPAGRRMPRASWPSSRPSGAACRRSARSPGSSRRRTCSCSPPRPWPARSPCAAATARRRPGTSRRR